MKNFALIATATLFSAAAQARDPLNDLSHLTTKQIDINVVTTTASTEDGAGEGVAIFYLDHPYTNTIRCEITASVPVVSDEGAERVIKVTMPEELIFPKAAFPGQRLSYDIDLAGSLKESEHVKVNYRRTQKGAAVCTGLGPNYRLPKRTCLALNENHDQICRDMAGGDNLKYPIYKNDQYLGICSCD